jgi:hypothetical protein
MWGLSGVPVGTSFSMRGAPCVNASVCVQGGVADTVCCRVGGSQYPGVCIGATECAAQGQEHDPSAGLPGGPPTGEDRADVMLKGAVLGAVAIGLVFLALKSGRK